MCRCDSTNEEDAKMNMEVADEIVDNPVLTKWYGTFPLENTVCSLLTEQKPKCCWGENYHSNENLPPTRER